MAFANSFNNLDEITFDTSVFDGLGSNSVIRLTLGELNITNAVYIDGTTGTNIVITGDANDDDVTVAGTDITDVGASAGMLSDNSRVFNFSTNTANGNTLDSLTITGGRTTGSADGGGIHSLADLSILDSTIAGNSVVGSRR